MAKKEEKVEVKQEKIEKITNLPVVEGSEASNRKETAPGIHAGKRPKFGQDSF